MRTESSICGGRRLSRRRVISIIAAASAIPLIPAAARDRQTAHRWTGQVLGAQASIVLYHPDAAAAAAIVQRCLDEVERLERVFSLYRPESELCRLNRFGRLDAPSLDMLALLAEARRWSELSGGAFDVSVQPLFALYAAHFAASPGDEAGPSPAEIAAARRLVDYRGVVLAPDRVTLDRRGMQLTLNGIAQGYIVDRVAELLRASGVWHVLLDLGEIRALDTRADGSAWRVGVRDPQSRTGLAAFAELTDGGLASSGGYGLRFDIEGRHHHLFDPMTGRSANDLAGVSVIAGRATVADALSTALAVTPVRRIPEFLAAVARGGEPATVLAVPFDGPAELLAAEGPGRIDLKA